MGAVEVPARVAGDDRGAVGPLDHAVRAVVRGGRDRVAPHRGTVRGAALEDDVEPAEVRKSGQARPGVDGQGGSAVVGHHEATGAVVSGRADQLALPRRHRGGAQVGGDVDDALAERGLPDVPVVTAVADAELGGDAGHPARGVVELGGLEVEVVDGVGRVRVGPFVVADGDEQVDRQGLVEGGHRRRVAQCRVARGVVERVADAVRTVVAGGGVRRWLGHVHGCAQDDARREGVLVGEGEAQRAGTPHRVAADGAGGPVVHGAVGGVDVVDEVARERGLHGETRAARGVPGVEGVGVPAAAVVPGRVRHDDDHRRDAAGGDELVEVGGHALPRGLGVPAAVQQVERGVGVGGVGVAGRQVDRVVDRADGVRRRLPGYDRARLRGQRRRRDDRSGDGHRGDCCRCDRGLESSGAAAGVIHHSPHRDALPTADAAPFAATLGRWKRLHSRDSVSLAAPTVQRQGFGTARPSARAPVDSLRHAGDRPRLLIERRWLSVARPASID